MVVWTVWFHGDGDFDWFHVFGTRKEAKEYAEAEATREGKKWKYLKENEYQHSGDADKYAALIKREGSHYFGA